MKRTHPFRDAITSAGTGVVFVLLGLIAADDYISWGFAVYTTIMVIASIAVFVMLPRWRVTRCDPKCRKPVSPWVQGAMFGLVVWLVTVLFPFTGDAYSATTFVDSLISAAGTSAVFAALTALLARFG